MKSSCRSLHLLSVAGKPASLPPKPRRTCRSWQETAAGNNLFHVPFILGHERGGLCRPHVGLSETILRHKLHEPRIMDRLIGRLFQLGNDSFLIERTGDNNGRSRAHVMVFAVFDQAFPAKRRDGLLCADDGPARRLIAV